MPTIATPTTSTTAVSFDLDWRPEEYLAAYYRRVENDERATMAFLVDAAAGLPPVDVLLEIGCGPTVHHLLPFARRAAEIHVADYLASNLEAVRAWVDGAPDRHDWRAFTTFTLQHETGEAPSAEEVTAREELTRRRIRSFLRADARLRRPLLHAERMRTYPGVLCCFCPDSITDDPAEWRRCMANVAGLVAPGGWLVVAALGGATSYRVGSRSFPSAGITPADVHGALLRAGFPHDRVEVRSVAVDDDQRYGFGSLVLAVGRAQ